MGSIRGLLTLPGPLGFILKSGFSIWAKLDDIGRDLVTVEWAPSHTSRKEASARGTPWLLPKANRLADDFAKRGAKMHPASPVVESQSAFVVGCLFCVLIFWQDSRALSVCWLSSCP